MPMMLKPKPAAASLDLVFGFQGRLEDGWVAGALDGFEGDRREQFDRSACAGVSQPYTQVSMDRLWTTIDCVAQGSTGRLL
jgi:hypothetical protein